jgi:hypothetical protein
VYQPALPVVAAPTWGVVQGYKAQKEPMKKIVALLFAAAAITSATAATNVGVSIDIHQPGVYGRINIGNVAPPMVVYPQPTVIVQSPMAVHQQPIYLYVPPGHQRNWAQHCRRYNACGQPVYFVQEQWVRERYQEHRRVEYREQRRAEYREPQRHEGRDGRGDRRDQDRGERGRRD